MLRQMFQLILGHIQHCQVEQLTGRLKEGRQGSLTCTVLHVHVLHILIFCIYVCMHIHVRMNKSEQMAIRIAQMSPRVHKSRRLE